MTSFILLLRSCLHFCKFSSKNLNLIVNYWSHYDSSLRQYWYSLSLFLLVYHFHDKCFCYLTKELQRQSFFELKIQRKTVASYHASRFYFSNVQIIVLFFIAFKKTLVLSIPYGIFLVLSRCTLLLTKLLKVSAGSWLLVIVILLSFNIIDSLWKRNFWKKRTYILHVSKFYTFFFS